MDELSVEDVERIKAGLKAEREQLVKDSRATKTIFEETFTVRKVRECVTDEAGQPKIKVTTYINEANCGTLSLDENAGGYYLIDQETEFLRKNWRNYLWLAFSQLERDAGISVELGTPGSWPPEKLHKYGEDECKLLLQTRGRALGVKLSSGRGKPKKLNEKLEGQIWRYYKELALPICQKIKKKCDSLRQEYERKNRGAFDPQKFKVEWLEHTSNWNWFLCVPPLDADLIERFVEDGDEGQPSIIAQECVMRFITGQKNAGATYQRKRVTKAKKNSRT